MKTNSTNMTDQGALALVLHGHLPFVRNPDHDRFLEEDWLFEAITECYLPLLEVFERLLNMGVPCRCTLSLSPTLLSMLTDDLLCERYLRHITRLIELSQREILRTALDPALNRLAHMYAARFTRAKRLFQDRYKKNLIQGFVDLSQTGSIELVTCAATHAFLPLLQLVPQAVKAQIHVAAKTHERLCGQTPKGIWLPECGYYPALDQIIARAELGYFVLEAHGLLNATPRPLHGVFAPVACPSGVVAFARDLSSSRQVWSATQGYPGDAAYREFYRDIGFDLDLDYIAPYVQSTGERKNTGIKYYQISEPGQPKSKYQPELARAKAQDHAHHFVRKQIDKLSLVSSHMPDQKPIIVAPYDAELFGHWWFEGPSFLEFVWQQAHTQGLQTITLGEYLDQQPTLQQSQPCASSWGQGGYNQVWLDKSNDWIYRHLFRASDKMVSLANKHTNASGVKKQLLNQAARELMLAQSSDWAFIIKTKTAVGYAMDRLQEHLGNFWDLVERIENATDDLALLTKLQNKNNLFPDMDFRCYNNKFYEP